MSMSREERADSEDAIAVLAQFLRINEQAPDHSMCDQRDNDGDWYQSADLAAWLVDARTIVARPRMTANPVPVDAGGEKNNVS